MDDQVLGYLSALGNVYQIRLRHDNQSNSGLIFYEYELVESWQDRLSRQIRDALNQSSSGRVILLPPLPGMPPIPRPI